MQHVHATAVEASQQMNSFASWGILLLNRFNLQLQRSAVNIASRDALHFALIRASSSSAGVCLSFS